MENKSVQLDLTNSFVLVVSYSVISIKVLKSKQVVSIDCDKSGILAIWSMFSANSSEKADLALIGVAAACAQYIETSSKLLTGL